MQLAGTYHATKGSVKKTVVNTYLMNETYGDYPWYGEINYAGRMIVMGWLSVSPNDKDAAKMINHYKSKIYPNEK